jgi:nucleoside-diphosphate-sugar epimerase
MKHLVTGGAGFIGSHLVDRLLNDGHEVIVLDDFSEGRVGNIKNDSSKLTIAAGSILNDVGYLFKDVDTVFHLAAKTRPQESIVDPDTYNHANIKGTLNVLESCVRNKVRRLVFVSSSSIYGMQEKQPTSESAPDLCMSPYALTKLIGEKYCKLFERLYGLEANYIRPFNVFGTKQSRSGGYGAAVPNFIYALRNGDIPYITGDGEQARDFIYIDDVIELMILASETKIYGEAFNAGSETNISINNLYKTICELMGKDVEPKYIKEAFEPRVTLASMNKAKNFLGWKLKTGLEEGLKKIL